MFDQTSLQAFCAWPGVDFEVKWGDDWIGMVAGKMFCALCENDGLMLLSFKTESERFLEWTDRPGICPAPYLARAHWVQVAPGALEETELQAALRRAYELVRKRLTKAQQRALAEQD